MGMEDVDPFPLHQSEEAQAPRRQTGIPLTEGVGRESLVLERTQIPSRSFVVGRPAKIKGEVTQSQLERIEAGVRWYLDLTEEYKKQGL